MKNEQNQTQPRRGRPPMSGEKADTQVNQDAGNGRKKKTRRGRRSKGSINMANPSMMTKEERTQVIENIIMQSDWTEIVDIRNGLLGRLGGQPSENKPVK